jgi:hypothetical protein
MYDANYIHLISHQRETTLHNTSNIVPTQIYPTAIGWRAKMYARLGATLISLGNRLREASHIQDTAIQTDLHQECC